MSTVEDFENAPVGATATHSLGSRAMKIDDGEQRWITPSGNQYNDGGMVFWEYTLDLPAPTTVREALDLAWELAHEVKPGQVIPADTRFLEVTGVGLGERIAHFDFEIDPSHVPNIRTLEPLPDPEPDWLDAPAVIAVCWYCETETLHALPECGNRWKCAECHTSTPWRSLTEVTPLYPEEGQAT